MKYLRAFVVVILLCVSAYSQQPCQCPPPVLHWRAAITPTEIREFLSHSHNLREWNKNVAKIRELNSGQLPRFWQREIIDSQYFDGLQRSWGHGLAQEP